MRTLWQDLRYGARVLSGNPAFTVVAALTLALGIAVNTTVFSWVDTVLLKPLPGAADGNELVIFESVHGEGHNISYPDFRDYRDHLREIGGLALSQMPNALNIGEGEQAQRVWGELVSGNYFDVLGVRPFLGRFLLPEEKGDKLGAYPVAVISHRLWRTHFLSDPAIAGKTVRVNQHELTIIGVAPPEFCGAHRGLVFEMWIPLTMGPQLNVLGEQLLENRRARGINAFARLKPGVSIQRARAEVAALAGQLAAAHPDSNEGFSATLLPESEAHGVQSMLLAPLRLLMAACLLVLLIACVNVANLLLARATVRQKELSIRLAMGAGRGRLVRQLLAETLLLAGVATAVAIPIAAWMSEWVGYLAPSGIGIPAGFEVRMNLDVLAFTILLCAAAALVSGISPALHAVRPNVSESLKEDGRGASSGSASRRMRGLLVISEVALALVALVGAGLFAASFRNARAVETGFDARGVLVSRFYLSTAGYDAEQQKQFCLNLRRRVESAPGVLGVSYADTIPLGFGLGPGARLQVEGYLPAQGEDMSIGRSLVAPGFFSLLRIPLIEGRDFTELDAPGRAPVMIVNQAFARHFYGGVNPVGRRVQSWGQWLTIVGLVRDSKQYSLTEPPRPYFYAPFAQTAGSAGNLGIAFYVRTAGDPNGAIPLLRREAAAASPATPAFEAVPLTQYIETPLFAQRFAASLLSALAALSILLAAVGLYGVMAYTVSRRTVEIGIRMALGAGSGDVLGMVVRQGMLLTAVGIAAGVAAALAAARLVAGMLLNVSATDPLIFGGAALFLAVVSLMASAIPAWRASRVDPIQALHRR